ncbi:MAG: GNAT family N-acetyltransferase [Paludibacteraceae bacterium]|nr:GNAT family N-acetyltransferase [Paludibacteraceae bacterium]
MNNLNKEIYRRVCLSHSDIPLFMQYWWMQAVTFNKAWDVLLVYDAQGEVIAAMPYLLRRRMGMKYVICPQHTQINGIWTRNDLTPQQRQEAYDSLIRQLEALHLAYYYQQYPLSSEAPQYMRSRGFKVKQRWTYRIEDLTNLDAVISKFSKNKKRQLQKALSLHADFTLSPDEFYTFHEFTLQEKGKTISYSRDYFLQLYNAALTQQQGQLIAIRNAEGTLLAAVFLVWDHSSCYFLIPAHSSTYAATGAPALLVLEAVKWAHSHSHSFDFEGSMIKNIENSYRQFGAQKVYYQSVHRYYQWIFRLALLVNAIKSRKKR